MGAFVAGAWAFLRTPLGHFVLGVASMVAVALMLLGFKHSYDEHRRAEGRAEFAAVTATCADALDAHTPSTCAAAVAQAVHDRDQAKANAATLQAAIARQNGELEKLERARDAAKARAAAAEKEADDNAAFYVERLKELRHRIDYPSKDPNADADRILRDLATDRLRRH